jgi:hypothetical protein
MVLPWPGGNEFARGPNDPAERAAFHQRAGGMVTTSVSLHASGLSAYELQCGAAYVRKYIGQRAQVGLVADF